MDIVFIPGIAALTFVTIALVLGCDRLGGKK
jgi:hypothetical protein